MSESEEYDDDGSDYDDSEVQPQEPANIDLGVSRYGESGLRDGIRISFINPLSSENIIFFNFSIFMFRFVFTFCYCFHVYKNLGPNFDMPE